jgi:solute carrier family 40 (iron-regulated transporter), member 1
MKSLSLQTRLLLGRLLTRSGDQAWDFAVPIVLLKLFPDQLRIAALYFFLAKLLNVLLLPRMASLIDRLNRLTAARIGVVLQLIGVLLGTAAIITLSVFTEGEWYGGSVIPITTFAVLVVGGVLSSLGSGFMDIAIANDLVPSSLKAEDLSKFNSRLRQTDLFTEVTSPVIAGLLLLLDHPLLLGFYVVALWNVVSFFPELGLIRSVLKDRPELLQKTASAPEQTKRSLLQKLTAGWHSFFKEPVALAAIAYAFLWLSVLSPHGVLLAGYLKDGWHLPEWAIGTFRGAGAVFGLLATIIFPWAERRWGLLNASRNFIVYQTATLMVALGFFLSGGVTGQIGFLVFILLSRIGLYGFSLGEMQIRQVGISPNVRGEVNGFASALTGIATLGLYGAGTLLPSTEDFNVLIVGSVGMVAFGCLTYIVWLSQKGRSVVGDARSASIRDP